MNDRALKVLEQYELEVTGTRRGRGSYILETTEGLRILCDYTGSENKALFQNCVMNHLREGGYEKVDLLLPNKEGKLISQDWEENKYVVKEWYTGRECDTTSENEIMAAVCNLARIHRLMYLEGEEGFKQSFTAQSPLLEIRAQNAELKKIRSFIRKKNTKGEFERLFLNCFSQYFEQAQEAEEKLARELESEKFRNEMNRGRRIVNAADSGIMQKRDENKIGGNDGLGWNMVGDVRGVGGGENMIRGTGGASCGENIIGGISTVCHGDYNHHHILMSGYDIATTNFECCKFDFQINDLYRFMRKILEKHEWNPRLGMRMLEHYAQIRPVSVWEKRMLYVRMLYPEKFRKLANYYYGSNKAWISRRYLDKMEKLNRQEESKAAFVRLLE